MTIKVDELTSMLPSSFDRFDSPVHCYSPAAYIEIVGNECVEDIISSVAEGGEHGYVSNAAKGDDHGYTSGKKINIRKRRTRRVKDGYLMSIVFAACLLIAYLYNCVVY